MRVISLSHCELRLQEAEWVQTPEDELHALHTHGEDQKSEKRAEELQQALTMQAFFNRTSSQLTEYGLLKLHEVCPQMPFLRKRVNENLLYPSQPGSNA